MNDDQNVKNQSLSNNLCNKNSMSGEKMFDVAFLALEYSLILVGLLFGSRGSNLLLYIILKIWEILFVNSTKVELSKNPGKKILSKHALSCTKYKC